MKHNYSLPSLVPSLLRGIWAMIMILSSTAFANAQSATIGPRHHLSVCQSGELWGWGDNTYSQLVDNSSLPDIPTPQVLALFSGLYPGVIAAATSAESSYALLGNGHLITWGSNSRGELGFGSGTAGLFNEPYLTSTSTVLDHIVAVAAGEHHVVVITEDGKVWAWGANDQGQLGDGSTTDRDSPVPVIDIGTNQQLLATSISAAGDHTVALGGELQAYSWGSNQYGELGRNSSAAFETYADLIPIGDVVQAVAAQWHCLALDINNQVWSWGYNYSGQLGDGTTTDQAGPIPITMPTIPNSTVYVGYLAATQNASLAFLPYANATFTWGSNDYGELGNCEVASSLTPQDGPTFPNLVNITGAGTVFTAVGGGTTSTWGGPDSQSYLGYPPDLDNYPTSPYGGSCQPQAIEVCAASPVQPVACVHSYFHNTENGANYDYTVSLPGNSTAVASDIGEYGVTTTIDASADYGGQVIFDGIYHVRGNVRFIGGTFDLMPGTVFYVDGLSGQYGTPTDDQYPDEYEYDRRTFIEVENATLHLMGARLDASCGQVWGGVRLLSSGIIITDEDGQRSAICNAFIGVDAVSMGSVDTPVTGNSEYYLNATDFTNNHVGLHDETKYQANSGEGAHYCTFSMDPATAKAPFNYLNTDYNTELTGIWLRHPDVPLGTTNYSAASIDHCDFQHQRYGIRGAAQLLSIESNTFDDNWRAAIWSADGSFYRVPMTITDNSIQVRGSNPHGDPTTYGIFAPGTMHGNHIYGDTTDPTANTVEQVGIAECGADGSSFSGNTLEYLDSGLQASASTPPTTGSPALIMSGNLFRGVMNGIDFNKHGGATAVPYTRLSMRCNTFENPGNLTGAVGINIVGALSPTIPAAPFPPSLGSYPTPNGNKFGVNGVLSVLPIKNDNTGVQLQYYRYSSSTQEVFPSSLYWVNYAPQPGVPVSQTVCGPYAPNGVNNRGIPGGTTSNDLLQAAYDSLRLTALPNARSRALETVLVAAIAERADYAALAKYVADLPEPGGATHASLATWLLEAYYQNEQVTEAQQVRSALLRYHGNDPIVVNFVHLTDVQQALKGTHTLFGRPSGAALTLLREVANSNTPAAQTACRMMREYEPTCPCRLQADATAGAKGMSRKEKMQNASYLGFPYPNPANDWVSLPYHLPLGSSAAEVEVRDLAGRLLRTLPLPKEGTEVVVPVTNLSAGIYLVTLRIEGRTLATRRVAVTH